MPIRTRALLIASLTLATVSLTSIPVAANAAARPSHIVSSAPLPLPAGGYRLAAGLGAMWAVRADEFNSTLIFRIDPRTNVPVRVGELPFPAASFAIADGSLWISDYFGNAVWRVSPRGVVDARIATGLQPEAVYPAFGSVWVANHHGHSVSRINPATDRVIATDSAGDPTQFRNGPQNMTSDGRDLLIGSSNLNALQSIDPVTDTTTTPAGTADQFCGARLTYAGGHVWNADVCSNALFQLQLDGAVSRAVTYGPTSGSDVPAIQDATAFRGDLWVAVDEHFDDNTFSGSGAVLERHDPVSGALIDRFSIGGDASTIDTGFGSLWVFSASNSTIRRMRISVS